MKQTRRGILKGGIVAAAALAGTYDPPSITQLVIPKTALAISPWSEPITPFAITLPPPLPEGTNPQAIQADIVCGAVVEGLMHSTMLVQVGAITEQLEVWIHPDDVKIGTIGPYGTLIVGCIITADKSGVAANGGFILTATRDHDTQIQLKRPSDGSIVYSRPFVLPVPGC